MPGFAISREGFRCAQASDSQGVAEKNEIVEGGCLSHVLQAVGLSAGRGVRMIRSVL
jgi:hypothetical protein